jgi:putative transcriptional regulator
MSLKKVLKGGTLLHATKELDGTYFENSLILLLDHNSDGLYGVIVNRPTHMPLSEVFNPVPECLVDKREFFSGGPVDDDNILIVEITSENSDHGGVEISPNVKIAGDWKNIVDIIESNEKKVKLFLGYTGWKLHQLIEEIDEGSWSVHLNFNPQDVLENWTTSEMVGREEVVEWLDKAN